MKWDKKIFGESKMIHVILIVSLFTFVMGGFKYIDWPIHPKLVINTLSVLLLFFFIKGKRKSHNQHFSILVLLLAFYPFLSVIYSFTEYNQPVIDGIKGTLPGLLWLSYFFFHSAKLDEGSIMKAIFCIALFIASVQIIQQFTYPDIFFDVSIDEEAGTNAEIAKSRNGLWRFRLGDVGYFAALVLFYIWEKIRKHISVTSIIIFSLMAISIYLSLTRQIIFSSVVTIIASILIGRDRQRKWTTILIIALIAIISFNYERLFGELTMKTEIELNEDNIRVFAGQYYLLDTFSSVKTAILGHGAAVSGTFLDIMTDLQENWRFFVSDVGFIGQMWKFGVPYVIICFYLLFNLFFTWRHYIPNYIRLFVLFTTIMSVMIFPMAIGFQYVLWGFLLYICDMNIMKKEK